MDQCQRNLGSFTPGKETKLFFNNIHIQDHYSWKLRVIFSGFTCGGICLRIPISSNCTGKTHTQLPMIRLTVIMRLKLPRKEKATQIIWIADVEHYGVHWTLAKQNNKLKTKKSSHKNTYIYIYLNLTDLYPTDFTYPSRYLA